MTRRAVVVSPDAGSDAGGTERFCNQVARLLERLGYDATVVTPPVAPPWLARQGAGFLWQARAVRAETDGADLVVTSGYLGWPGMGRGRRVHVYVGNMLRLAPLIEGRWHWRLRWGALGGLADALAGRGATVVAGSEQAAEDAARFYRARVQAVLPLGVDTELFRPRDRMEARRRLGLDGDGRYALFVGRGEPGKGPRVALEASRRAGFDLLAAGARPVEGSRVLGVLPSEELAWAYAAADAVVLPTRYEGFGYVAVEGLAAGVPVVTTPTGWARELGRAVPAYRPLLVAPVADAVAGALSGIGSDEVAGAVAAARSFVLEHNTLDAFARRWAPVLAGP
ncbi:MAG: glycosyltransferase family 4 protein [Actinomycetota bacterium]|nr:glycosyltransferase family 4 protein [Actinomycetota bacterium]